MINSFTHFRALAIVMIVAGHSLTLGNVKVDSFIEGVAVNIIIGGTSLFVFISGFLFKEVFLSRYQFKRFFAGKLSNVGKPYLLISLPPVILYIFTEPEKLIPLIDINADADWVNLLISYVNYLLTGQVLVAYWYIPFILLMFFSSPLHVLFTRLNYRSKIFITVSLYAISLFLHRPIENINPIQSLIYFTPVYLIGMLASEYKDAIYRALGDRLTILGFGIILVTFIQTYSGKIGNYHSEFGLSTELDLMLIQKTILAIFLMVLLNKFEKVNSKIGDLLARTSFAIFFFHPIIISIFLKLKIIPTSESWLIYTILVSFTIILSTAVAVAIKAVLKDRSRSLTGY